MDDTKHITERWNTPVSMLSSRVTNFEDYVLVGKSHDGSTTILSSGDDRFAQSILKEAGFSKELQPTTT